MSFFWSAVWSEVLKTLRVLLFLNSRSGVQCWQFLVSQTCCFRSCAKAITAKKSHAIFLCRVSQHRPFSEQWSCFYLHPTCFGPEAANKAMSFPSGQRAAENFPLLSETSWSRDDSYFQENWWNLKGLSHSALSLQRGTPGLLVEVAGKGYNLRWLEIQPCLLRSYTCHIRGCVDKPSPGSGSPGWCRWTFRHVCAGLSGATSPVVAPAWAPPSCWSHTPTWGRRKGFHGGYLWSYDPFWGPRPWWVLHLCCGTSPSPLGRCRVTMTERCVPPSTFLSSLLEWIQSFGILCLLWWFSSVLKAQWVQCKYNPLDGYQHATYWGKRLLEKQPFKRSLV